MSKKGDEDKEDEVILGRPGNNVKIGLVGLPNVGKSSLFNLLGNLQVPAENYPFCTIDPANTVVPVPDERFDHLVECWKPKKVIPAVLTVTDIAGLVKGASEGKGLGNAFLSHIQAVDALFHIVRAFADEDIEHVEGSVDPIRDLKIIQGELVTKDLARMNDQVEHLTKLARAKDPQQIELLDQATRVRDWLAAGKEVRFGKWNNKEIVFLNTLQLLTAKPAAYLVNISEKNFEEQKNKWLKAVKDWVNETSPGSNVIPFSVTFEQRLKKMEADERKKYLAEKKLQSMVPRIIIGGYRTLGLIHYFTVGHEEVRAWTIRKGTKAPQAAGVIHSDFEKFFIAADTYNYDDFKEFKSEQAVKDKGKCRSQGKEYVMKDGDICFFKQNAKKK